MLNIIIQVMYERELRQCELRQPSDIDQDLDHMTKF